MLPKNQRLTGNRVEYLLKKGRKSGNQLFTVKYLPNRQPKNRFCVITSTKTLAKATDRNLLRRRLYEIFRLHPELPAKPTDIVVIAKQPLTKLNFKELTETITSVLQNLTPNT